MSSEMSESVSGDTEDPDEEECMRVVARLEEEITLLTLLSRELELKLNVKQPIAFKHVRKAIPERPDLHVWPRIIDRRVLDVLNFYKLCGMSVSELTDLGMVVRLYSGLHGEYTNSYYMKLLERGQGNYFIEKGLLPRSLSVADLRARFSLDTLEGFQSCMNYTSRCILAFHHRREQVLEAQAMQLTAMEITNSANFLLVEIRTSMKQATTEKLISLIIELHYQPDCVLPFKLEVLAADADTSLLIEAKQYFRIFKTLVLKEAFGVMGIKEEEVEEDMSSTSMESDEDKDSGSELESSRHSELGGRDPSSQDEGEPRASPRKKKRQAGSRGGRSSTRGGKPVRTRRGIPVSVRGQGKLGRVTVKQGSSGAMSKPSKQLSITDFMNTGKRLGSTSVATSSKQSAGLVNP